MAMGKREPRLQLSAITSSIEEMPISKFLVELWAVRVSAIDLYVRGCDVAAALGLGMKVLEHKSLIERLAGRKRKTCVKSLADYVRSERDKAASLIRQRY